MKAKLLMVALFVCAVLCVLALSGCNRSAAPVKPGVAYGAYDTELDCNYNTKLIKLAIRNRRANACSTSTVCGATRMPARQAHRTAATWRPCPR